MLDLKLDLGKVNKKIDIETETDRDRESHFHFFVGA